MNNCSSKYLNLMEKLKLEIPLSAFSKIEEALKDRLSRRILKLLSPNGYPTILSISELARELKVHHELVRRKIELLEEVGLVQTHRFGKFRKVHLKAELIPERFKVVRHSIEKLVRAEHSYQERLVRRIERKEELSRTIRPPYPTCLVRCPFCGRVQEVKWDQGRRRCPDCGHNFRIRVRDILEGKHFRKLAKEVHLRCPRCREVIRSHTSSLSARCPRCRARIEVIPANCLEKLEQ